MPAIRTYPNPAPPAPAYEPVSTFWTWTALLVALVGVAGTLWLSLGLDLIACPLCFYQRTFILSVAGALLMGLGVGAWRNGFLSLVTMPLTVAGLAIAGVHVYKEYNGELECPDGAIVRFYEEARGQDQVYQQLKGQDTAPRESLALFGLLFLVQLIDVLRGCRRGAYGLAAPLGAILVGGLLAAGAYFSTGPGKIPPRPQPLQGCRPLK